MKMVPAWTVRRYRIGDEEGILKLIDLAYQREESIAERAPSWNWLYRDHPYGHFIGVAEHNEQIIGHMAVIPTLMKVGDRTQMGCQAVGLVVHPNFRRQGIFVAVGSFITNEAGKYGIEFGYGFPNLPAHGGHLKYGWFDVCKVPILTKFVSSRSLLNTNRVKKLVKQYHLPIKFTKYLSTIASALSSIYHKMFYRVKKTMGANEITVREVTAFDSRFDDFWKEASEDHPIIVVRDCKYLNWRYFQKPGVKYTAWIAEKDEKVLGFVVALFREKDEVKQGFIVDLLTLPQHKNAALVLISKAIRYLRRRNVDSISCWMLGNKFYHMILRNNAFMPVTDIQLIVRINSQKSKISREFLKDRSNWYITMGDSDLI